MHKKAYEVVKVTSTMAPGYRVVRIADGEAMAFYSRYDEQEAKAYCFALQASYEQDTDARIPVAR